MTENQIKYWSLQEDIRHNKASEGIQSGTLDETIRSNQAKEKETNRSNLVKEAETERTNRTNETLKGVDIGAKALANIIKLI